MLKNTGQAEAPPTRPSQPDEFLRRARIADVQMSPADVAAHEAASYVRQPAARPLPVESGARRRAITTRGW